MKEAQGKALTPAEEKRLEVPANRLAALNELARVGITIDMVADAVKVLHEVAMDRYENEEDPGAATKDRVAAAKGLVDRLGRWYGLEAVPTSEADRPIQILIQGYSEVKTFDGTNASKTRIHSPYEAGPSPQSEEEGSVSDDDSGDSVG